MNKLCSIVVIVLMAAQAAPAQDADKADSAQIIQDTERSKLNVRRESFRAIESSPADEELDLAIRRLEAVRLQPKKAASPEATTKPSGKPQPDTKAGNKVTEATNTVTTKPAAAKRMSQLDRIKSLPPGSIADPVALADALYMAGHTDAAAVFYEKAMESSTAAPVRSWLLFQLGNCSKDKDPQAARGYYKRLMAEHPESIWKVVAEVADRLIEWKLTNAPDKLLKSVIALTGKP